MRTMVHPGSDWRKPRRSVVVAAIVAGILAWSGATASGQARDREAVGTSHALLINGGGRPSSNYLSHLHHLEGMVDRLLERGIPASRIHIFSADGEGGEEDLAVRDTLPEAYWLIDGTRIGRSLRPRTEQTDTVWSGVSLKPARKDALERWFERAPLVAGDRLLLFVTDHGTINEKDLDDGAISLWKEKLTVRELEGLLAKLPVGVRTVMVMSQCYSGTFGAAMYGDAVVPSGDVCGFFSTSRDQRAYGCYPEGEDKDRIGHAFRFIDALGRRATTDAAHREVVVTDDTPDVPLRTSDLYLEQVLEKDAIARGVPLAARVDALLALAWQDRAAWEETIRLLDRIGDAYGLFSPRSLSEIETYQADLPDLIDRVGTYADRWEAALVSLKEENLRSLRTRRPEWKDRLSEASVGALEAAGRQGLMADLLPSLEWNVQDDSVVGPRLTLLRDRSLQAADAKWRLQVRLAAVRRMRSILMGVAGRVLLATEEAAREDAKGPLAAARRALDAVESCEAFEPGSFRPPDPPVEATLPSYPPLADEIALIQGMVPSWLGVRFGAVPEGTRAGRDLEAGATWIRAVYPDSPALEAGLEAGDVVLGSGGVPFHASGMLREWTMIAPSGAPLTLDILRPGERPDEDARFEATVFLRPFPEEWPKLPGPPQVGEMAPRLPDSLKPVGRLALPALEGRSYLVVFWATWCLPCKESVPEVLAFAKARDITVLGISDEETSTVERFLESRKEKFFENVAVDTIRRSQIEYGVSGTPTFILVDAEGRIAHRQVGYKHVTGLKIEGWTWPQE